MEFLTSGVQVWHLLIVVVMVVSGWWIEEIRWRKIQKDIDYVTDLARNATGWFHSNIDDAPATYGNVRRVQERVFALEMQVEGMRQQHWKSRFTRWIERL
mgnify:CR=1